MNTTLREMVKARRAAELPFANAPRPHHATKPQGFALTVEATDGGIWVLPWHRFFHGYYQTEPRGETLALTFASHEVVIGGRNLAGLADAVAEDRLHLLRDVPAKYARSSDSEPFIAKIEVRPLKA